MGYFFGNRSLLGLPLTRKYTQVLRNFYLILVGIKCISLYIFAQTNTNVINEIKNSLNNMHVQ